MMANDKIFLQCRGCQAVLGIYKHFGHADPTPYITGSELSTWIAKHLYCASYGDGHHLHEPSPFEAVTDYVLMQREGSVSETFVCAMCRGTFPMGDDDEAIDELKATFGDVNPADCELFCDDCFKKVKP